MVANNEVPEKKMKNDDEFKSKSEETSFDLNKKEKSKEAVKKFKIEKKIAENLTMNNSVKQGDVKSREEAKQSENVKTTPKSKMNRRKEN